MRKQFFVPVLFAAAMFTACSSNKSKPSQQQRDQLLEAITQFNIDTLDARPQDTIFSNEAGSVLRHYPELYHATLRAKKAFDKWTQQSQEAGLTGRTDMMDISAIIDETLLSTIEEDATPWPTLASTDSLYLQLLANESDINRKSDIGRTRRAWLNYTEQLQRLLQAVPEECRTRYMAIIARRGEAFQTCLKQQKER